MWPELGGKGVSRGQIIESCVYFAKDYLVSDGESSWILIISCSVIHLVL